MFYRVPQVAADASFVDHSLRRFPSSSSLSQSTPLRHKTSNSEAAYHPYKSLKPPSAPPSTSKPILFVDTTSQAASSGEPIPHCRPKRKRITPEQLVKLTAVFQMTESPSYDIRDRLGAELDMTNREVQVWFQNRRAKVNRQKAAALVKEEAAQSGAAGQGALSAGHSSSSYFPSAITPPSPYTSTSAGDASPASASGSCYFSRGGAISPFTPNPVSSPSGAFLGLTLDSPHLVGAAKANSAGADLVVRTMASAAVVGGTSESTDAPPVDQRLCRPCSIHPFSGGVTLREAVVVVGRPPSVSSRPSQRPSPFLSPLFPRLDARLLNNHSSNTFPPVRVPTRAQTSPPSSSNDGLVPLGAPLEPARLPFLFLPPFLAPAPLSFSSHLVGLLDGQHPGEPSLERIGAGAREASTRESLGLGLLAAASELRTDDV
ncbi:hypothetical protein JCM1840_000578 [Sporobolomyces johnsonii]